MSDEDYLNEILSRDEPIEDSKLRLPGLDDEVCCGSSPSPYEKTTFDYIQWSTEPNGIFRASGKRVDTVPPGVYRVDQDPHGIFLQLKTVLTDDLIEIEDSACNRIMNGIRKFWKSKDRYVARHVLYKRGIAMLGPAGGGKTATIELLAKELIGNGGIVIICEQPSMTKEMVHIIRKVEPDRPMIILYEDIDELINRYGEHDILALLDGENQIENVVNIATSNYPERLGGRILNRPSRFDERIYIGMPSAKARERYLRHIIQMDEITEDELQRWITDTDKFTMAHLKELVVAVFCLEQEYKDVIERLKSMKIQPKDAREFGSASTGFTE